MLFKLLYNILIYFINKHLHHIKQLLKHQDSKKK